MKWAQEIERFIPNCAQEEQDKIIMLEWAKHYKENALLRTNTVAHFTSSAFILNETRDKALMIYHNIYNAWSWTGGHTDGDENFLAVAKREAMEETGITKLEPITKDVISQDIIPVFGHIKNGNYVSAHLHLSVAYAFIAPENQPLQNAPKENSAVQWISLKNLGKECTETEMVKIYNKIISRVESL